MSTIVDNCISNPNYMGVIAMQTLRRWRQRPSSRDSYMVPRPQPFLPPPAAGLSPTIFGREMTPRDKWRRRAVILAVFNWITIAGVMAVVDPDSTAGLRTAGVFVSAICLTMSIVAIRNWERRRIRAGREWLSDDGDNYIRLDQLKRVEVYRHSGITDHVSFVDSDEREVHFPVDVLAKNQRLRRIVLDAIEEEERQGQKVFVTPKDRRNYSGGSGSRMSGGQRSWPVAKRPIG
jgi:hypothetical protein